MLEGSRKGMPTVMFVVGLVSTLLVGSAIMGSLQAIKTTSLDPNVERTQDSLDQVGDTVVTIGSSDPELAKKQMQGAIVWNMLAASDCRILATTSLLTQAGQSDDFELDDLPDGITPVDGKAFKVYTSDFLSELSNNEGNGYTGNFDSFLPLEETGFDQPCIGTQSTIKQMEDATKDASNNLASKAFSGAYKVVGAGLVITGIASCPFTGGSGCVAAAAGVGMVMESDYAGDMFGQVIVPGGADDIGASPGFDMEGVFSRMEFDAEQTFTMGTDDRKDPFLGLALKFGDKKTNTPGFWRGRRLSYLVPAGLNPDTFNQNEYHRIYDPGGYAAQGDYYYEDTPDHTSATATGSGATKADALGIDEGQSKLTGKHFWNGHNDAIGAPGTNQERNEMMFYAFRPRMENVPIIAGDYLTDDDLTEGCDTDGCERPVMRLANFLEQTSYLFCEGASGQIQSNAGHIYSSDEATSQEGPVEDQVYPKVEITDGATDCIPTMTISVPDEAKLACNAWALMEGHSTEIFSRDTVNREEHSVEVVCGTDDTSEAANLGGYGYVDYYVAEKTISKEGCYSDWYDITSDSYIKGGELETEAPAGVERAVDSEAYTLEKENYPMYLYKNSKKFWSHDYDNSYSDGDGYNEIGGDGDNNRINYERISVRYNASAVQNLTYRISMQGVGSVNVPNDVIDSSDINRTVVVEERPESSETIVREIVENSDGDTQNLRQVVNTSSDFSGAVREIVVDRTSEGGIMINGRNIADFEGFPEEIAVTNIEISPVRNAGSLNRKYDWGEDNSDVGPTQADFELRNVETYSKPRVCKGERGIWKSQGKDIIGG